MLFYDTTHTGELTSRMGSDIQELGLLLGNYFGTGIINVVQTIGSLSACLFFLVWSSSCSTFLQRSPATSCCSSLPFRSLPTITEDAWKSWVASSRTTWPKWAFAWRKRLGTSAPWSGSTRCVSLRRVSSRSATNISTTNRRTSSSSKTTTNEPKSARPSVPAWGFPWSSPSFAVSGWVETWS